MSKWQIYHTEVMQIIIQAQIVTQLIKSVKPASGENLCARNNYEQYKHTS